MLSAVDTLVEYLHGGVGDLLPLHLVHSEVSNPDANRLHHMALNITLLGKRNLGSMEHFLVSLDLLWEDEREAWGLADTIAQELRKAQFTPEFTYDPDPNSPAATGRTIAWSGDAIEFRPVSAQQRYIHLNSTFTISHARG